MPPRPRPRPRPASGQASSDYVGLLALIAVVAALAAAAVTAPPLAGEVLATMRHGICLVGGGICTAREARDAGLDACVVHVRSNSEAMGAVIAVVRLRRGDTAVVERRSDGTAIVSFLDENAIGAQTGVGLQFSGIGARGIATAGGGLSFHTGRSYELSSWTAARAFLARWAREESTAGEARNLVRRLSPVHEPRALPAPGATWFETGTWAELEAELAGSLSRSGVMAAGEARAQLSRVIGRRRSRTRDTWYFRVDGAAAARLGMVAGAMGAATDGTSVLEVTSERGRLLSASVTSAAGVAGELSLYGHTTDLGRLADRIRRASAEATGAGRGGMSLQTSVSLDLTVAGNRAALVGALDVLRLRSAPEEWPARIGRLGDRLNSHGRVDVSLYRSASSEREESAQLGLGLQLGLERLRTQRTRELIGAWTAQGGPLREREDCVARA